MTCPTCGQVHPGCAAHTKNGARAGQPCGKRPLRGLRVCAQHGGNAPRARAAAARRQEEQAAAAAVRTLGLPLDVSPTDALLEEVRWTAGHVAWLRERVQELDEQPTHHGRRLGAGDEPEVSASPHNPRGALTWGTTKVKTGGDDAGVTQEAVPSIWYTLYSRERDHLVKVAAAAIKAGVETRKVELAEKQGLLVASVLRRILDGMLESMLAAGMASSLRDTWTTSVQEIVPRELRAIASGDGS